MWIDEELDVDLYKDGLILNTTLDSRIQRILNKYFNEGFNKNIVCHIHGFMPFFYIKIPETWKNSYIKNTFTGDDRGIDI